MNEEPIREKLQELRELATKSKLDITRDIDELERKLSAAGPLNEAWRRVQLARHPERPTTLEYARLIFDEFIELPLNFIRDRPPARNPVVPYLCIAD